MMRTATVLFTLLAVSFACAQAGEPTRQGKTVKAWTALLAGDDAKTRLQACQALGDFGSAGKVAVGDLAKLLKDGEPAVRYAAAGALRRIGPAAAPTVAALVEAMKDADEGVRTVAIQALGGIGPKANVAVPALCAAVAERDRRVAVAAIEALGGIGLDWQAPKSKDAGKSHKGLKDALARAMADPEPAIRLAAVRIWGEIATSKEDRESDVLVPSLGHADGETRMVALRAWQKGSAITDEGLNAVFLLLEDADPLIRRLAAMALFTELDGMFGERQTAAFKPLLLDVDALVRITAARALARVGNERESAFKVVLQALKDEDPLVRAAAIEVLPRVRREDKEMTEVLLDLCKDKNPRVRRVAAETLVANSAKGEAGIKVLVELLKSADSDVRAETAVALGTIATETNWHSIPPALLTALDDPNPAVRQNAALALGSPQLKHEETAGKLTKRLEDKAPLVRVAAALSLMRLKVSNTKTLAAVQDGLSSGDAEVRLGTLRMLKDSAVPKELVAAIEVLRDDPSPEIRRLAAQHRDNAQSREIPAK